MATPEQLEERVDNIRDRVARLDERQEKDLTALREELKSDIREIKVDMATMKKTWSRVSWTVGLFIMTAAGSAAIAAIIKILFGVEA